METQMVEQNIEDIKSEKRIRTALLSKRWKEALKELEQLEKDQEKLYINGKSEEVRQHCVTAKEKVKIREG